MFFIFSVIFLSSAASLCDVEDKSDACTLLNPEAVYARSRFPHPTKAPIAPPLPRIHVQDLDLPQHAQYKSRNAPFILTGAMDDWPALERWKEGNRLSSLFPKAVCDYYPYNMLEDTHPYLIRFATGLSELKNPIRFNDYSKNSKFICPSNGHNGCRYLHMQLSPKMWDSLEDLGDIPKEKHIHFKGDSWWMRRCMEDPIVQAEYFLKTHWKIILIGSSGSGMFNHTDTLQSSSWHGHIQGRKWWYICRDGKCYEAVLHPGEVIYYGKDWWHHTRILDPITTTITGTIVTQENYMALSDKLYSECTRSGLKFDFSGALCDALDKCYSVWHKILSGKTDNKNSRAPWRKVATWEEIKKKRCNESIG